MKKQKYNMISVLVVGAMCLLLGTAIGTVGTNYQSDYESVELRLHALENEITILENQIAEEALPQDGNPESETNETASGAEDESASDTVPQGETVWKTKNGRKYHKENCSFLSKGSFAISVEEAKAANLEPCKRCFK